MSLATSILLALSVAAGPTEEPFRPIKPPDWVGSVTRMAFLGPDQVDRAADAGTQVVQTNLIWPYYPLRRDGGGLSVEDRQRLKKLVDACHTRGMKLVLGLPPFPPASLIRDHPDWRIHPKPTGAILKVEPREDDLGTRNPCNLGPWGDYFIELCAELVQDYQLDGYSFDGNYHPALCYCPACKAAYRAELGGDLPNKVDLDDLDYRRYLIWRGRKLEDHYRRLQERLKAVDPDTVLMSWTVNAGRYGHLLMSPRAMTTRTNLLFDLPMQEWWLDETNLGASIAPAFGAAYLRGIVGGSRPVGSEPYLMARGNPAGTDSFPKFERIARTMLATTHGNIAPQSFGWPGHLESTAAAFRAVIDRERWLSRARPMRWAGLLVSERTRQFVAYRDIPGRFLPSVYGAFRAALEEHRPLELINDWDLTPEGLAGYRVIVLAGPSAISETQADALRQFVRGGGGLVATSEATLCDELGRPRRNLALADLFGVALKDGPSTEVESIVIPESFWKGREVVGRLTWADQGLMHDNRLNDLVPGHAVSFRGPLTLVTEPADPASVVARFTREAQANARVVPAIVARREGQGRIVYLAAGLDAALWSYSYPYQRRVLDRALLWAAGGPPPVVVEAPLAVQSAVFEQDDAQGRRVIVHLFNGIDTTAGHGKPGLDAPLREESVPIHGIRVRLKGPAPTRLHIEPGGREPLSRREGDEVIVELPPLEVHSMLVGERP